MRRSLLSVATLAGVAGSSFIATTAFAQRGVVAERRARGTEAGTITAGARLGATSVQSLGDPALSYGVYGDYALSPHVLVGGSADYWSKTSVPVEGRRAVVSDTAVGAQTKYLFSDLTANLRPWAGAGLVWHRFDSHEEAAGETPIGSNVTNSDIKPRVGADVAAGVLYRLTANVDLGGELRYRKILQNVGRLDQTSLAGALSYQM
jgi:hypothetical protein